MKRLLFIMGIALLSWACAPGKESSRKVVVAKDADDTTEYRIRIDDLQFNQWYLVNYSPAKDRTNEYYRTRNDIAVSNWNEYYRVNKFGRVIWFRIDYWPNIDYGINVNRMLYWYFRYIEENYRISLFT